MPHYPVKELELQSYLKFGYNLNFYNPEYALDFSGIDKGKYQGVDLKELVQEGGRLLLESFDRRYSPKETYLVPLSGGADSRAILAMLLRFREAADIYTYTFGTPGTLDYDLGGMLASRTGTRHQSFDLTRHPYTPAELEEASRRFRFQSPLFLHPPIEKLVRSFQGMTILSGANAGAVVGSFVPEKPVGSLEEAKLAFCRTKGFARSTRLHSVPDEAFADLMTVKPIEPRHLTFEEQVMFNERSVKHLAPHVLLKGFTYQLPFINNPFMDFMLSVDNRYRKNKFLYKEILVHTFPGFFGLPIEGNYGLSLKALPSLVKVKRNWVRFRQKLYRRYPRLFPYTSPMINYLDFEWHFRKNPRIRGLMEEALLALESRNLCPWIPIRDLWKSHLDGNRNVADALLLLFSLEYHLRAGFTFHD